MSNMRESTTAPPPKTTKRQVSFARTTRVMFVPSLYEMTDAEMSATWYSDDDSDSLQGDIVHTIKAMRKGIKLDDSCYRGLEHMRSPQHLNERKFLKKSTVDAVLAEQDHQRCSGVFDPEEISRVSFSRSRVAAELALTLAAADESFVRRTLNRVRSPTNTPARQQRIAAKNPTAGLENDEICFSVLENALALSSAFKRGDNSTPPSLSKNIGITENRTAANSSRISRILGSLSQEQTKLAGKKTPASSSIDLIQNKLPSGLTDKTLLRHGSMAGGPGTMMNSGVMGLRAMMMR